MGVLEHPQPPPPGYATELSSKYLGNIYQILGRRIRGAGGVPAPPNLEVEGLSPSLVH